MPFQFTEEQIGAAANTSDISGDQQVVRAIEDGAAALAANPGIVGTPMFVVGSITIGLQQIGFVPAAAGEAPVAIIMLATGAGALVASLRAMSLGQSAIAACQVSGHACPGSFGISVKYFWPRSDGRIWPYRLATASG